MARAGAVAKPAWQNTPTLDFEDGDIREWMKVHLNELSPRRRWWTQQAGLKLWFYLGRQWVEALSLLAPHMGGYHYAEVLRHSSASFPRPVTNLFAQAVDNEVSRLAKKEYVPDTSAGKHKPEWMAAARLAKDVLMHEIGKAVWDDKREELIFNLVIDSITICRSWWDENDVEVTLVASPDAVKCPMCNRLFASAKIPGQYVALGAPVGPDRPGEFRQMLHTETLEEVLPTGEMTADQAAMMGQVRMKHCPYCEQMSLLKGFDMSEEEAATEDSYGRPMGLQVPRGEGLIDVISIHEYYPENAGVGVEPHAQRIHSQCVVRGLEWIALRYPEFRDNLTPEDPSLLLRYNPLYSEQIFLGPGTGFGGGVGYDAYYNHARVFETIVAPQPIPGLEQGAHFCMVNDRVARRPLCVAVETEHGKKLVPRIQYHFARFKRIPKNFYGRSFTDDFVPLQRRLNEIDAQTSDLREHGKPNMWTPYGTELYYRDDVAGSLNIIEYDSALGTWSPRDGLFPGIPLTGSVYAQERQDILRDMQALGAPQDIEMGQSPGGVKTTSGLMLLSEEASQKRAPRERAMIRLYESTFQHFLQLNWAFRKEDAEYEVHRDSGIYELQSYTGSDLLETIKVKLAARTNYDQTLYNKEAAAEALQLGLYKLDSPAAVDRILDLMRLPKDVNENQTFQIQRAEMAWSNFMDVRAVPAIDPTIHDPLTWYSVLGKRWLSDEAYTLQEEAGWQALIPRLVTWPQRMAMMEAAEAPAKAIYGNVPQEQWPAIQQQGEAMVQAAMDAYQQAVQSYQQAQANAPPGVPPPPPPEPPAIQQFPEPPPQGFLPDAIEQKIYTVWRRMLPDLEPALQAVAVAKKLADVVDEAPEAQKIVELEALMRMRAVIEGFRLMASGPAGPAPAPGTAGGPTPPGAPGGPGGGPPPPGPGPQPGA